MYICLFRMMSKIKESQERMVRYHERRNQGAPEFSVGDKVLLRNKKRDDRKGGGMSTTWSKKIYTIAVKKGKSVYMLEDESGVSLRKGVNGCHLKKFVD